MAKKNSKEKSNSVFVCPSCKGDIKPTFGTITGISPQKCKCGKFLVAPIWLTSLILGGVFALWYGFFMLVGIVLPLIVQLFLIPVWLFFGYKIARSVMFRFISARDLNRG